MSNLQEYVVIERDRLKNIDKEIATTADLIAFGGSIVVAKNADEAEEVYACEHGGSISELVTFIAWREAQ